jgi:DNA-binding winged helix-turn-helix (wHTH) protein
VQAYRFGDFTFNRDTRELLCGNRPVHVSPKAFHLLELLVQAAPRALSKAELQERLWPDTFVVEANLQHLIGELRAGLADDPRQPRYLRTVHGFGYAFLQPPVALDVNELSAVVCRLSWSGGRVSLTSGEHIVGRDGSAAIVLDAASVSRRHARIRLSGNQVALEDLGSKNGTYVGGRRIEGTVTLADGNRVRFGRVPVTVHISRTPVTTETAVSAVQS